MANDRPFLIGLTGSIGMGKTETAKMFAALAIPVYDADAAVHALYAPGGAAVEPIARAFLGCIKNGGVDRNILAQRLGSDAQNFAKLEAIVHPLVAEAREAFIAEARAKGTKLVVLNIPLLFETGAHKGMDVVVVVSASPDVQRARVLTRPGMTEERFTRLLARQMPDAQKRKLADFLIETDKGLEYAAAEVGKIVQTLEARLNA